MTDAPKKIWATGWFLDPTCRWWSDKRLGENTAQTEYTRADLCADPALLAEAVEVLRSVAAINSLSGREHVLAARDAARAFIAKWEARHDR